MQYISVEREKKLIIWKEGGWVCCSVRDERVGISRDERTQVKYLLPGRVSGLLHLSSSSSLLGLRL